MQADAFLQSAERLLNKPTSADARSAISRAYYAVFLTARSLAHEAGLRPRRTTNDNVHENVYKLVRNCGVLKLRDDVARDLQRLREMRVAADYFLEDQEVENPDVANHALTLAKEAVMLLKAFASAAKPGMVKYNKDTNSGW